MKLDPINLIGGFYQDDNLPWSAQDTVNWIPRPAEMPGTISQMKLVGAPGLSFLADIDDDPVRIGGFRNVEGRMFIVAGTTLYELNTDLTTTVRGTIPGAGPVTMAHNQLEFGNELCIGNGSGTLYVWNTWTSTFTVVTDDAATGSVQSVYLNRRIIHLDPFGRFGYPSDIDSATSYDSLDRFDSEASPDKLVGLGVSQFELVALSQRTTEFYSITDATEQPFRPKRIAINRGCAARNSIVQLGGTLAMLGDDGIFYRLQGYQWEPISTGPVNKAIEGNNWANCFGFVYEDRKHEIAYWTFPDGQTWGYDAWTGLIHRRESFGLNRWRINAIEKWNDMWIAGDFQSGRIYRIDWDAYHEYGHPLVARRVAPPIYNNGNKIVCPMIELVFDTGRGALTPLEISGDLGDAVVSAMGSYAYSASGGAGEITFSISGGSLPPGATLGPDGVVTYHYTTTGSFSWEVTATDTMGNSATLQDSNQITGGALMATNLRHYTGEVDSMAIAPVNIPWNTSGVTINIVSLSPDGMYLLGSHADSVSANRFQILKFNIATNTWSAVAAPATLPAFGPTGFSWHPSGNYVAVGINASGVSRVFVYKRVGDVFTKLAQPATIQNVQSTKLRWSPDGTKLSALNGDSSNNTWVYPFDASTDTIGNGRFVNVTANNPEAMAWLPGQSRYVMTGSAAAISLIDTDAQPNMTIVDTQVLTGSFPSAAGGISFSDNDTMLSVGLEQSALNGPVAIWNINPAAGASAITFVGYPADKTTFLSSPYRQASLSAAQNRLAIARNVTAVATPYAYTVSGESLAQFNGVPTGATGTVTSVSWRGEQ